MSILRKRRDGVVEDCHPGVSEKGSMCSGIIFAPMLCAISFREGVCIALHAACCLGFRLPYDRYSGEYGLDHDFFLFVVYALQACMAYAMRARASV
jgi:hypothetical protein